MRIGHHELNACVPTGHGFIGVNVFDLVSKPDVVLVQGQRVTRIGSREGKVGAMTVEAIDKERGLIAIRRPGYTDYVGGAVGNAYSAACILVLPYKVSHDPRLKRDIVIVEDPIFTLPIKAGGDV